MKGRKAPSHGRRRERDLEQPGADKAETTLGNRAGRSVAGAKVCRQAERYFALVRGESPPDSETEESNPRGERAPERVVPWRDVQRLQVLKAFTLLSYKRLQDEGISNLPDLLKVAKFLVRVCDDFSDFSRLRGRDEDIFLHRAAVDTLVLWVESSETLHQLGPTPPALEDLGDQYKDILAAIECLGGWDRAICLQNNLCL